MVSHLGILFSSCQKSSPILPHRNQNILTLLYKVLCFPFQKYFILWHILIIPCSLEAKPIYVSFDDFLYAHFHALVSTLAMACSAMTDLSKIWADRGNTRTTKVRLVQALVFPIALYASETWTLNKADCNRIAAFEMWCWRRTLRIPWTKRRTSASILEEIGVSKRLLHTINIQMLSYFGHIARRKGNNLENVIMQCIIEGKRRKGRRRSRWIHQIRSAIGLPLRDCYALAEDHHLWRRICEVTSCQPWQERTNQQVGTLCVCTMGRAFSDAINLLLLFFSILFQETTASIFRPWGCQATDVSRTAIYTRWRGPHRPDGHEKSVYKEGQVERRHCDQKRG